MGNPAGGILVLLLALYLLLAFFAGRLEWLFRLSSVTAEPGGPGGDPGDAPVPALWRPGTTFGGWRYA